MQVSYPVESKSLGHGGLSRGGPDGLQGGIQLPMGTGSVAHQLRDAGNLASLGDGPGGMDIDEVEGFNPFSINLSGFQVDTDDGSIEPQLLDMLGVVLTMQTTLIQFMAITIFSPHEDPGFTDAAMKRVSVFRKQLISGNKKLLSISNQLADDRKKRGLPVVQRAPTLQLARDNRKRGRGRLLKCEKHRRWKKRCPLDCSDKPLNPMYMEELPHSPEQKAQHMHSHAQAQAVQQHLPHLSLHSQSYGMHHHHQSHHQPSHHSLQHTPHHHQSMHPMHALQHTHMPYGMAGGPMMSLESSRQQGGPVHSRQHGHHGGHLQSTPFGVRPK